MQTTLRDLRYALRQMRHAPGFAMITVLTLALGLGAAAAVFSVMDAMLIRPLPFDHPERILITNTRSAAGYTQSFSVPDYKDLRNSMPATLAAFAGFETVNANLQLPAGPLSVNAVRSSDNYFQIFGVSPMLGRTFARGEDENGRNDVAVLSHGAWRTYFNADPGVVGRTINLDGHPTVILGVMPASFRLQSRFTDPIFMPFHNERKALTNNRGSHWMEGIARMKAGVTREQALSDLSKRMADLGRAYPEQDAGRQAGYLSLQQTMLGDSSSALWALSGAVAALLLIACVNVAGLLLARSVKREREMALRAAVGASRTRMLRQVLTESLLLGLISAVLGIAFAYALLAVMRSYLALALSRGAEIHLNGAVLLASLTCALFTAVVASLLPAVSLSRLDPNRVLKAGGNAGTQRGQTRLRSGFAVVQVMLSVVLLALAGLLLRVLQRSSQVELGFDAPHLLSVRLDLPVGSYQHRDPIATFYQPLLGRLQHAPGVLGAGVINVLPVQTWGSNMDTHIAGQPPYPKNVEMLAESRIVSEGYFQAMGIPLQRGRLLSEALDGSSKQLSNMVVNRAFVRKFFPGGEDPLGARIDDNDDAAKKSRIIGVVGDVRQELMRPPMAELDWLIDAIPMEQRLSNMGSMSLVVRSAGDPSALIPAVRNALQQVDPAVPMRDAKTMRTVIEDRLLFQRMESLLFGIFAALAVLLAMAGLYGLVSQEVEAGTRDTGVRMALGATRAHVLGRVLSRVGLLVASGAVLGLGLTLLSRKVFASVVELQASRDGALLTGLVCSVILLGLLAALLPARRAASIDPMKALRTE